MTLRKSASRPPIGMRSRPPFSPLTKGGSREVLRVPENLVGCPCPEARAPGIAQGDLGSCPAAMARLESRLQPIRKHGFRRKGGTPSRQIKLDGPLAGSDRV